MDELKCIVRGIACNMIVFVKILDILSLSEHYLIRFRHCSISDQLQKKTIQGTGNPACPHKLITEAETIE